MTQLIAHRGASKHALENTKKAFEIAAYSNNVYGIETDIWITLDDIWVCSHESNPFNDKKIHINQVNYQDIKNLVLDIPKAKYQDFVNNYLCTFNEYLDVCQKYNKIPIVELKQPNLTKTQLINLIKIITQKKMLYKTSFISFEYDLLNLLKLIEPKIVTYDLIDTKFARNGLGKTGIKHAINLKHNISVRHFLATKSLIKIAHDNNVLISIWTVDKKSNALKYQKRGIDFITSNDINLFNN